MKRIAGASLPRSSGAAPDDRAVGSSAHASFAAAFSRTVIDWQKKHGRHALPWQNTRDAYRIWLSEIMLQQTQVAAVIPYYLRFLERFPDVASLAAAPAHDVMELWSGLGYYSRARNLHLCAKRICEEYGGVFPSDPKLLAELPGIGRSTAAAIAAFACGARAAILDGNVKRVLCRVFGVEGFPGEKAVETALWQRAESLLPEHGMEAYTQGLMDLGATVCTRSNPSCSTCPLAQGCIARATGRVAELPVRRPRKTIPEKHTAMLVIVSGDEVLLERRPDSGIWGGLLSLPEEPDLAGAADWVETEKQAALALALSRIGISDSCTPLQPFIHAFSHYKLHVTPYLVTLQKRIESAGEHGRVWLPMDGIAQAPLPAPVKKLLTALFRRDGDLFGGA